jgi:sec-independent protein translocase protein TatA
MGLGIPELLIILIVVLIIFGPGKLPALGSGMGNALRNFRKAVSQPDAIDVTPDSERKAEEQEQPRHEDAPPGQRSA